MDTCSLDGCTSPRYQTRTMCASHYMKNWRYGDPHYKAPPRYEDKTGQRFGMLLVLRRSHRRWLCRCDCGNEVAVVVSSLNSGGTQSCGQHRGEGPVGYYGIHDRVHSVRGPAKQYRCVDCDGQAHDWSYNHQDPDERMSKYGPHASEDVSYYEPRCVRCHRIFDEHPWMTRSA